MATGDRHPDPPAADGGAATLPGVGAAPPVAGASAAEAPVTSAAGMTATADPARPPRAAAVADAIAMGATLPGAAAPAAAAGIAMGATLPGAAAPAAGVALGATVAGTAVPVPRPKRPTDAAHSETLPAQAGDTPDSPHAATLPGPHVVADLPSLPRVDDSLYAIGEEIARGGMGKILSARDRRLRRDVVIKVTRRDHGPIDPRFEREALITARLQHPSIVRVYDAGVFGDGRAFYAMERVRGRSLEVVIGECKNVQQRLALLPHAIAVCDAIAYAHSEGILHRDLKPSNILIGPFGETVVIDWGLAKEIRDGDESGERQRRRPATPLPIERASDADLTQHGAVLGTPSYMAPEQARGEPSDERSDIYALGALLYTMLSGVAPHRGKTTDEVLEQVSAGAHLPIAEREPGLPKELATLVEHAMERDPKDRIASAKELAEELRRFAAGKLLATHAYSLAHLIRRWLWRNRIAVGIAALAVVVLAVVAVIAVENVVHERDIANEAREQSEIDRLRADRERNNMVLDQARSVLGGDPSLSAAWLTKLTGDAWTWPSVHEVAVDAARMGLARELRGHTQDVELVAVASDGIHVATGSDDSTVRWWDLRDGSSTVLRGHSGPIEVLAMSPDGKYLASGGTDHDIWLWELASGTGRKLSGHSNTVRGVAFSPDSTRLASTGEEGAAWIWDVTSGTGRAILHHGHGLRPVIWYDDTTVIVGGFDGMMGRFNATTGKGKMKPAHAAELRCFALSPDHAYLVAGDEDGLVTLWTGDGTRVRTLGRHTDVTRKLIFTPDGTKVLSAGGDEHVVLHTIGDGSATELQGNANGVKDIAVSHDGKYAASAGIDGVVRVWTLDDAKLVREFRGHFFAVKAVAFTKDGRLVTGSEDDNARVWSLDDPDPPPSGPALKAWLRSHTNVEVRAPARH